MATIIINGQEYTLPEGEKLNAIQMAMRVGVEIPYYCWHPALSVVANCRMCEIEVGGKDPKTGEIKMVPKLVPGCQTPAKDVTVLVTDSAKVKEHQRMIMEYLLINHPLDCPVCDQAGECGLQDYSYEYGQSVHRFVEERTVNPRKDVSDLIQLNQDRCIMCTRCVRFTREITQTGELQVMNRGNHAEINIFPGHPVDNPLAGNVVDLCPVGALLDKDFLHTPAGLVPLEARRDLHPLLHRLQHQLRGEPGPALAVQAAVQPARQRLLDLRRGPLQLQGGQRPRACWPAMYVRQGGDLEPVADRPGAQGGRPGAGAGGRAGGGDRRRPLAVPDGRGSVPHGLVPQGAEPDERAGARAGAGAGRGPDLHARPDQGADRRHQLRRPPAVHDPRREVPEPAGRRGDPRALPG